MGEEGFGVGIDNDDDNTTTLFFPSWRLLEGFFLMRVVNDENVCALNGMFPDDMTLFGSYSSSCINSIKIVEKMLA